MANKYDAPVGFVVEGKGEFQCFPVFLSKISGLNGIKVPINQPQGYGRILSAIESELDDLVRVHSVHTVVICIDLKDVMSNSSHGFSSCEDLKDSLQKRADEWLITAIGDARLSPLPKQVVVVIQVMKFESWILGDCESLYDNDFLKNNLGHIDDVDSLSQDPCTFLKKNLSDGFSSKKPRVAKKMVGVLDVVKIEKASRSFRKFSKEVRGACEKWGEMFI